MTNKLREQFDEMVVFKDLKGMSFLKTLKLPSFLRDWVLKKFEDEDGNFDTQDLLDFVNKYMPRKEEWISIKERIVTSYERVKLLTKINVDISIKTGEVSFSLPEFGLESKETIIESHIWDSIKNELVKSSDTWGIVELGYRPPDDSVKPKIVGKIKLTDFTSFCPYDTDIDFYKDVRSEFDINEWIDILLGAMDYNSAGYEDERNRLAMLKRLLPFVEKNLNLIELAPKGTGKSYVFGNISKSQIEHHAILHTCASIEQVGNKVIYLPVDRNGIVDTNTLQEALVNKVALVSVMYANNEIGSLEPIHELCNIAHRNGAKFHTDAVQAVGHVKIDVKEIGVDMMSASAHKFNGPKGIGFLYVKTGTALKPFADGGAQEYGMRAGTENVAGIVAMSVALKKACSHIDDRRKHLLKLEDVLLQGLKKYNTDFIRNGSSNRVPGNISLSFKNANGEMLLHRLDLMGIMVSTGSACDSTNTQMSHVLKAIKIPEEYGFGTIRISFNHENTEEDAKYIAESIGKILTTVTKAKLKRS